MNDFDFLNESLRQMDKELQTQKELNELADIVNYAKKLIPEIE